MHVQQPIHASLDDFLDFHLGIDTDTFRSFIEDIASVPENTDSNTAGAGGPTIRQFLEITSGDWIDSSQVQLEFLFNFAFFYPYIPDWIRGKSMHFIHNRWQEFIIASGFTKLRTRAVINLKKDLTAVFAPADTKEQL